MQSSPLFSNANNNNFICPLHSCAYIFSSLSPQSFHESSLPESGTDRLLLLSSPSILLLESLGGNVWKIVKIAMCMRKNTAQSEQTQCRGKKKCILSIWESITDAIVIWGDAVSTMCCLPCEMVIVWFECLFLLEWIPLQANNVEREMEYGDCNILFLTDCKWKKIRESRLSLSVCYWYRGINLKYFLLWSSPRLHL